MPSLPAGTSDAFLVSDDAANRAPNSLHFYAHTLAERAAIQGVRRSCILLFYYPASR